MSAEADTVKIQDLIDMFLALQPTRCARGLGYQKWQLRMASEVFWRSGDARKVFWHSGDGAGVGGFGGSPPFENATSTDGAGAGGLGVPPF